MSNMELMSWQKTSPVEAERSTSGGPSSPCVASEPGQVDGRSVSEQDEGERQLGELPRRRRFDVDVEHAQHLRSEQQSGEDEEDGRTDGRPVEPIGHERVPSLVVATRQDATRDRRADADPDERLA